ncbi:TIGR03089 family protein [Euzebya tangerina]|uniref:TIGR03089 family protein n=1 Tax=Euzebya tangerina TaxID=591198 RepID=UPI000E30E834|nr:TIGR03089 family protein [Euzebya tangerina]
MPTLFHELTRHTRDLGDHPAVVFVDAGTGERTELGFRTLHNWVSKTANLLADALDITLGDEVTVEGPLHWLMPVACFATWACGAAVRLDPGGQASIGHEADTSEAADVLIGTGMGGRPTGPVPGEALTVTDILAEPDDFISDPEDPGAWAIGGRTQATLLGETQRAAPETRILHHGDRLTEDTVFVIARTLAAGTGLVLARGFDGPGLARLAQQEGVS